MATFASQDNVASAASSNPAPSASSTAAPTPGFNAVESGGQMQSGEALLVEAYIAIWVLLFAFIVIAWRRTRRVEDKVAELEKAIERAKSAVVPSTKRSASEPPAQSEKA